MEDKINIIVVDDHEIFRNGLKMVLGRLKNTNVIGEATNGKELLDLLGKCNPDIILLDIEMPEMNGIEAAKYALNKNPELKIIVLTMFNNDEYIQNMIDIGVKGFLIKNINKETLEKAIQNVVNGGNYYSEELFNFFTKQISKDAASEKKINFSLTRREKEILQLICEGLSNKEIAEILFVSERTIVGHKTNLLSKTNCKNTMSLMSYAIKNKLVVI